jgi:hypothetical protein
VHRIASLPTRDRTVNGTKPCGVAKSFDSAVTCEAIGTHEESEPSLQLASKLPVVIHSGITEQSPGVGMPMADQPRFADTLLITPNVMHNLGVLSFKCALDIIIKATCHHAPAMAHVVTCSLSQAGPACYWCLTRSTASMLLCSRIFASLIAGLALGVVGYAGWSGFLWYFLAHALVGDHSGTCMPACQRGCR